MIETLEVELLSCNCMIGKVVFEIEKKLFYYFSACFLENISVWSSRQNSRKNYIITALFCKKKTC